MGTTASEVFDVVGQATQPVAPPVGRARYYFDTTVNLWLVAQDTAEASQYWPVLPELAHSSQDLDDFEDTAVASQLAWTTTTAGLAATVSTVTTNVDANHFGMRELSTGLTATGRAGFYRSLNQRLVGGSKIYFETLIRIPTLSVAAQRYTIRLGLGDFWNVATLTPVQGVYFEYDEATSLNWRVVNQNGAVLTAVDSGVAVVAGAFIKLAFFVQDVGPQSTFYINGVQVPGTPIGTNLPTGLLGFGYQILKSAGLLARTMLLDYFLQRTRLTVAR